MEKIGILYICTGKYSVLWKEFYESFEKYFLASCERHYFVFTDAEKLKYEDANKNIHRFYQPSMPWPYPAVYRYRTFTQNEDALKNMDYVFFCNANLKAVHEITKDMVLPRFEKGEELVVTSHPGFLGGKPDQYPYDRNPNCSAYIPFGSGEDYVAGGLNGGKTEAFLRMCHELSDRTDKDLEKGVIARWHDESHINEYILRHNEYRLLSPAFLYPEGWRIPIKPIILVRNKSKYFDVAEIKGGVAEGQLPKYKKYILAAKSRLSQKWNYIRIWLKNK